MARAAFVLDIRHGKVDDYVAAHREVWPEMREALRRAGFRNYSIHLHGRQAFAYFEADDPVGALEAMAGEQVNTRWQDRMAGLLEERVTDTGPRLLPEIFRLD